MPHYPLTRVKYDDRFVIFLLSIIKLECFARKPLIKRITIILFIVNTIVYVICTRMFIRTGFITINNEIESIPFLRNASIYFVPRFDLVLAENIVVLLNLNILKSKYENGKGCLLKQYFLVRFASVCHVINDLIIEWIVWSKFIPTAILETN